MKILAIETSCDDTSIAITDNYEVIAMKIHSQIEEHQKFGGIVPELASRLHSETIFSLINITLLDADVEFKDIDAIAVTQGPGLTNALQVGITVAKTLSHMLNKPLYGINHLEAHAYSAFINTIPSIEEAIVLIASGGHTILALKKGSDLKVIGETKDDSVGEAFDKVAKIFGLPYPGGPIIDEIYNKYPGIKPFPVPIPKMNNLNFSYSGMKSFLLNNSKKPNINKHSLIRGFQESAINQLLLNTEKAIKSYNINNIIIGGGVTANSFLRKKLSSKSEWNVFMPKKLYTNDNAAMIAYLCFLKIQNKKQDLNNLKFDANPRMKLGN